MLGGVLGSKNFEAVVKEFVALTKDDITTMTHDLNVTRDIGLESERLLGDYYSIGGWEKPPV